MKKRLALLLAIAIPALLSCDDSSVNLPENKTSTDVERAELAVAKLGLPVPSSWTTAKYVFKLDTVSNIPVKKFLLVVYFNSSITHKIFNREIIPVNPATYRDDLEFEIGLGKPVAYCRFDENENPVSYGTLRYEFTNNGYAISYDNGPDEGHTGVTFYDKTVNPDRVDYSSGGVIPGFDSLYYEENGLRRSGMVSYINGNEKREATSYYYGNNGYIREDYSIVHIPAWSMFSREYKYDNLTRLIQNDYWIGDHVWVYDKHEYFAGEMKVKTLKRMDETFVRNYEALFNDKGLRIEDKYYDAESIDKPINRVYEYVFR